MDTEHDAHIEALLHQPGAEWCPWCHTVTGLTMSDTCCICNRDIVTDAVYQEALNQWQDAKDECRYAGEAVDQALDARRIADDVYKTVSIEVARLEKLRKGGNRFGDDPRELSGYTGR